MRKLLGVVITASILVGCGGEPVDGDGTGSSSSSTSSSSSSGSSSNSTSSSSSSSSSSGTVSDKDFDFYTASASAGATKYEAQCKACHGSDGSNGITTLKVDNYATSQALFTKIVDTMPPMPTTDCEGQCAADITAFLNTWRQSAVSCQADDGLNYGVRGLKVLTAQEYENSLEDLGLVTAEQNFKSKVPADATVTKSNYPNNSGLPVTELYANKYFENAQAIADAAAVKIAAGCDSASACKTKFNALAYKMFRRPLTNEEKTQYGALFDDYGNAEGMKLAIFAAMNAPQFLYRSEMGVPVTQAISEGWGNNAGGEGGIEEYEAQAGGTTVNALNFATKTEGGDNEDQTWNLWAPGTVSHSFTFSDPAILTVNVKANDFKGAWPEMTVKVNGDTLDVKFIEGYDLSAHQYLVTGVSGAATVSITYSNTDQGEEPWGRVGFDKNLYVGDVMVSGAVKKAPTQTSNGLADKLAEADPDAYVLDDFEFASVLSYAYTGSTPDDALLSAAAAGKLSTPAQVQSHIDRMIASPRGREHVGRFAGVWLNTDEVETETRTMSPGFTEGVKQDMMEEVRELFRHVFFDDTVPFEDFYGGNISMLNSTLAEFYGIPFSGSGWTAVQAQNRGGLLTTGAFLTANAHDDKSSPIQRAVAVRELMLCHHIDPPPTLTAERETQFALVAEKEDAGTLTSREYYEIVTDHPACDGCHKTIINPLFGTEDFDQVGRFRTTMTGLGPNGMMGLGVNTDGELIGTASAKGTDVVRFNGAKGLGQTISDLPATQACFIQNSFRYLTGLPISKDAVYVVNGQFNEPNLSAEQAEDFACVNEQLTQTYTQSNSSPKAVFSKVGTLDLMRFRK